MIKRRDFITGTALGIAGAAGVTSLGGISLTALAEEAGVSDVKMKPGVWCGSGQGYSPVEPVDVKVEVDETSILSVEIINKDINHEEPVLMGTVEDLMIPRIVETQSVDVDSITAATGVSVGVKLAVEDALKKALVAGGSDEAAVEAFRVAPERTAQEITLDYDVVVCGMGGAGTTAAMSAAEQQAAAGLPVSVLAIETGGKYGGTAAIASEAFGVNPTKLKDAYNGGEDFCDYDSLYEDWIRLYSVGNPCKEDLVKLIMDESGPTIDWMMFEHGFLFSYPKVGFGGNTWQVKCQHINAGHLNDGADVDYASFAYSPDYVWEDRFNSVIQYYDTMVSHYTALGGEYLVETTATELLYDADSNKVTGVRAVNNITGDVYTVNAKAVILATGGFGGSEAVSTELMASSEHPFAGQWYIVGCQQNKGQMIKSAVDQGIATYNAEMPPIVHNRTTAFKLTGFPIHYRDGKDGVDYRQNTWTLNDVPLMIGTNTGYLHVSAADGVRHANEAGDYYMYNGPAYWCILGTEVLDGLAEQGFAGEPGRYLTSNRYTGQGGFPAGRPIPEVYEVMDVAASKGLVVIADTLEELAEKMDVPVDDFVAQVERYRGYIAAGEDEEFGKAPESLLPSLDKAPFYAIDMRNAPYATCAALDVDAKVNCLLPDGTPVGGLFAAGNDSGGVLYSNSMPYSQYGGVALGWAYTSGRLCGISAVEYLQA